MFYVCLRKINSSVQLSKCINIVLYTIFSRRNDMWYYVQIYDMWYYEQIYDMWYYEQTFDMWYYVQTYDMWYYVQTYDMWCYVQTCDMWCYAMIWYTKCNKMMYLANNLDTNYICVIHLICIGLLTYMWFNYVIIYILYFKDVICHIYCKIELINSFKV